MRNRFVLATLGLAAAACMVVTVPASAAPAAATSTAEPAAHTSKTAPHRVHCPQLSTKLHWYGANRAKLQHMINARGRCSHPHQSQQHKPVAAFDWDNTVVKNDTTDATIAWALEHNKILRPKSWSDTSEWLTKDANKALTKACGTDVPVGSPLHTSTNTRCTDEIFEIRKNAKTMAGDEAFSGDWNHRRTVPEYAWVAQLFAGHTRAQLTEISKQARKESLAAPIGSEKKIGTHTMPAYVRYYEQQKDLIRTLRKADFDVYVVSAGVEAFARAWSGPIGFDHEHTIGIRSILRHGRTTHYTEGCGDMSASKGGAIPYIDGKRCWINQDIYGIKGADAWKKQDWSHRIALGGGDADTDVTFVGDATGAHLVLNRNEDEVMCRAYDNADGRWVINPMFIEPKSRKKTPYPCSSTAYTTPDGSDAPLLRSNGSVVPDQWDRVHA